MVEEDNADVLPGKHFMTEEFTMHKCPKCKYTSPNASNLRKHMVIHTDEPIYTCEKCGFSIEPQLVHKQFGNSLKLDSFSCPKCECILKEKADLCKPGSDSKSKPCLKTKKCNLDVKPIKIFSCSLCEYTCSTSSCLRRHLMVHTGAKPFFCQLCDYSCKSTTRLKMHIRTHTGEKPFSCHYCEYTCAQAGNLVTHIRTHTGVKPFACKHCDYTCTRAAYLRKHLKSHSSPI